MSTATTTNDLLLRAARGERTERTPVWLMRQAGRFDPAYNTLKEKCGLTLERMFRTPDLAAEITFLPKRLGVDALIIFQDILTPLEPMGASFVFRPGPVLERPIRSEADVDRLREFEPADELPYVAESLRLVKDELGGELPLLGFAGAPLTLAAFMVAGGSPGRDIAPTRTLMRERPDVMHRLLGRLADMTVAYLRMQIDAGADAVQLFESIGDLLEPAEYEAFAHPYHRRIFDQLGEAVPRILFVKEQPWLDLMIETGADVLSVGKCVDLAHAVQRYGKHVAFQGNVDNELLASGTFDEIERATKRCIDAGGHRGHILNLNHGLLRHTPFDNVCRLIDTCRSYRLESVDNSPGDES